MKRLSAPLVVIVVLALVARVVIGVDAARALGVLADLPPLLTYAILAAVPLLAVLVALPLLAPRPGGRLASSRSSAVLRSVFLLLVGLVAVMFGCLTPGRYGGEQARDALAATLVDIGMDARWGPVLVALLAAVPAVPAVVLLVFVGVALRRPPEQRRSGLRARTVLVSIALAWTATAVAVWLGNPTPMRLA